ncbi:hypothetical protein RCL1_004796 [Eukaryota sp. TZLM3-RCL]
MFRFFLFLLLITFLYASDVFVCIEGSTTIPNSFLNDGFCDCPDGSDEPETGVCAGLSSPDLPGFYCPRIPLGGTYISFSKVNDGIQDCCDCSDEFLSTTCTNTCRPLAEAKMSQLTTEYNNYKTALDAKNKLNEQGKILLESAKQSLLQLKTKKEQLAELSKKVDLIAEDEAKILEKDENNELNGIFDEGSQETSSENLILNREIELMISQLEIDINRITMSSPIKITRRISKKISKMMDWVANIFKYFKRRQDFSKIPQESSLQSKVSRIDQEINKKEKFFNKFVEVAEMQGIGQNWLNLIEESLTFSQSKYNYEIKLFDSATQSENNMKISLGLFQSFDPSSSLFLFENGERCWGGPNRSMKVVAKCGKDSRIISVVEEERCVYSAVLEVPTACQDDYLHVISLELEKLQKGLTRIKS